MRKEKPVQHDDDKPHWSGFTRSLDFPFPLEQIRKDGQDVKELEDEKGRYWEIIEEVLK